MDKLDWELTSSESEKHYPTPHEDHTLGTERGKNDEWGCTAIVEKTRLYVFQ